MQFGKGLFFCLSLLCWALCGNARADDTHYQDFIVGSRAIGLGGAYCAISDDPSGLYYNPAGILDAKTSSLQVASSLYGVERSLIDSDELSLALPGVTALNFDFADLVVIPASAGFVSSIGDVGRYGKVDRAYAISVIIPSYRTYSLTEPRRGDSAFQSDILSDYKSTYARRVTDRSLWTGIGIAQRISNRWQIGASAYYILRTLVDSEEVSVSAKVNDTEDTLFKVASNDLSLINGRLLFNLGVKYHYSERLKFGISFQSSTLDLHSSSQLRLTRGTSIPNCVTEACLADPLLSRGPESSFQRFDDNNAGSDIRRAESVRMGLSYQEPKTFLLSADVTWHGATDYQILDGELLQDLTLPLEVNVRRNIIWNANVGAEYLFIPEVSLALGAFTDFSSAPPIGDVAKTDQLPHVDLFGFTFSVGYFREHTLSRIGLVYSVGHGRDVIPTSDVDRVLEQQSSYEVVDFSQSFLYLFVSSSFRY